MQARYSFQDVLERLKKQSPEDKMRTAFSLTELVDKIYKAGIIYGQANKRLGARKAS